MLKIGEFSKLSLTTVKALRFYEKQGLLTPAQVDEWTGYRYYTTEQLQTATKIKAYRQLGLSISEIKSIFSGEDVATVLSAKTEYLQRLKQDTEMRLSIIKFILEGNNMKYQVTEKIIPQVIVYSSETVLKSYSDIMQWIPSLGQECLQLNPGIRCVEPNYEFCEYLDSQYKQTDIRVRHNEAVTAVGKENEHIKFRTLPQTKVLSIYHKGAYENIGEAYSFIVNYAESNGYQIDGLPRECYIDGIWNKDSVDDWLTEVQLPIK